MEEQRAALPSCVDPLRSRRPACGMYLLELGFGSRVTCCERAFSALVVFLQFLDLLQQVRARRKPGGCGRNTCRRIRRASAAGARCTVVAQ